ncbi:MAG TPA: hypothetical protein VFV87_07370 [Pirellulaceae bacterium]|nr:hypothetical protein [Pirellulaceae bacterium]
MAKRSKTQAVKPAKGPRADNPATAQSAPTIIAQPPEKSISLLGISILLFALWFIFLLVTALVG